MKPSFDTNPCWHSIHVYEVRPRKHHRGVDLISERLPFGKLGMANRKQLRTPKTLSIDATKLAFKKLIDKGTSILTVISPSPDAEADVADRVAAEALF